MYLALIAPDSYLPFERPVPFSDADGPVTYAFYLRLRQAFCIAGN